MVSRASRRLCHDKVARKGLMRDFTTDFRNGNLRSKTAVVIIGLEIDSSMGRDLRVNNVSVCKVHIPCRNTLDECANDFALLDPHLTFSPYNTQPWKVLEFFWLRKPMCV